MNRHNRKIAERREKQEARKAKWAKRAAEQPRVRLDMSVLPEVWMPEITAMPEGKAAMEAAVWRCANLILKEIPDSMDGWPQLEQMIEVINRQPGRWRVVSKVDHNEGTWAFEVVPRIIQPTIIGAKL